MLVPADATRPAHRRRSSSLSSRSQENVASMRGAPEKRAPVLIGALRRANSPLLIFGSTTRRTAVGAAGPWSSFSGGIDDHPILGYSRANSPTAHPRSYPPWPGSGAADGPLTPDALGECS